VRYRRGRYGVLDGAIGGIAAGLFGAACAAVLFPGLGLGGPWLFLNLVGATVDQSWARFDGFHWLATPYGLAIHIAVSLSVGVVIAWAASRSSLWATVSGALVAAAFWAAAEHAWLPLVNPSLFRAAPPILMAAGHLAFGLIAGAYLDVRGRTVVKEVQAWAASPTVARRPRGLIRRRSRTAARTYSAGRA
jgi:hypothetical protein